MSPWPDPTSGNGGVGKGKDKGIDKKGKNSKSKQDCQVLLLFRRSCSTAVLPLALKYHIADVNPVEHKVGL